MIINVCKSKFLYEQDRWSFVTTIMTNWGGGGALILHKKGATCLVCPGACFTPAVTVVKSINTLLNSYFFVEMSVVFSFRKDILLIFIREIL